MTRLPAVLCLSLSAVSLAHAERAPTAVLWVGGDGGSDAAARIAAVLAEAPTAAPLADAASRPVLIDGGPATQVRERTAAGRARFAALSDLPAADALLAEAEATALAGMSSAEACAVLIDIARLRLRFAELTRDEERARHAAWLLSACAAGAAEDQAAIARHPGPGARPQPDLRVESDPPGADVRLDLRPIGKTPLSLNGPRRNGALLDVELAGYGKVHRTLDGQRGTLAVALAHDDGVAALVDRLRSGPEAAEADVAELAGRVGATQLLAVRSAEPGTLDVRTLDTARRAWSRPPATIANPPAPGALDRDALLAYLASPPEDARPPVAGAAAGGAVAASAAGAASAATSPGPPPSARPVPAYKRWYTWVIGGALVGGIAAWLIAGQIGDDQITVHVAR